MSLYERLGRMMTQGESGQGCGSDEQDDDRKEEEGREQGRKCR